MITCNLSKPEATLDQVRKTYEKLPATDAALIAGALVLGGRYAVARYDEKDFRWPDQTGDLTRALVTEIGQVMEHFAETAPKRTKASAEDEPVELKVTLVPNYEVGEQLLGDRKDLKTLLSDILNGGVEYVYAPTDIGWQWALDRTNWTTLSEADLTRRVKMKAVFVGATQGVEMGGTAPKKRPAKKAPVEAAAEAPAADEPAEE